MNKHSFDVLIIGAGVTGCALARRLSREDGLSVGVLEKEEAPARHTSGRNSGVLHSGFNPKPGSLKATLCVKGNALAREFCRKKGVPCQDVGTVVVALNRADESVLEELLRRGMANGVEGLRMITKSELALLEPRATGLSALYAPTGSIVDNAGFVQALAAEAQDNGVQYFFNQRVVEILESTGGVEVCTQTGEGFGAGRLVNCAGLYADEIAHLMGVGQGYSIVPFRGQYWKLNPAKAGWVRSMIYPAPDLGFPFLGVHWTRTVHGDVLAGPNAVLAFGRESYTFFKVQPLEFMKMTLSPSFLKMIFSKEFSKLAYDQILISISRKKFAEEGSKILPGVKASDLEPFPKAGNRPQLINKKGEMIEDLLIEEKGASVHVLNTISPGFTCALAFADILSDKYGLTA